MIRFPILQALRVILWVSAALALVVAVPYFNQNLSYYDGYFFPAFGTIVPALVFALAAAVVAELIGLLIRMVRHLDEMKEDQRRTNQYLLKNALALQQASSGTPAESKPTKSEAE